MEVTKNLRADILEVFAELGKQVPDSDDSSIITAGILDSVSILELVNGLEERFGIFFDDEDLTLDNFDKLSTIESLVLARIEDPSA